VQTALRSASREAFCRSLLAAELVSSHFGWECNEKQRESWGERKDMYFFSSSFLLFFFTLFFFFFPFCISVRVRIIINDSREIIIGITKKLLGKGREGSDRVVRFLYQRIG